jgi:hypothetical protein
VLDPHARLRSAVIATAGPSEALVCPLCGGAMRILAFMTEQSAMRRIIEHVGSR